MGLPTSTRQRTLSRELLGLVPLFSLPGSHRSWCFSWLQPPRASLPILSDVFCPSLSHTAWQEKLEWTAPLFFVILQDMGESMPSYQNLKAAARAVYKDCSLKVKFSCPSPKHKTKQEFRWGFQARLHFFHESLANISSFSLSLAQGCEDHLLLIVTAGSMTKSVSP